MIKTWNGSCIPTSILISGDLLNFKYFKELEEPHFHDIFIIHRYYTITTLIIRLEVERVPHSLRVGEIVNDIRVCVCVSVPP